MRLKELLAQKRPAILTRWFGMILESYPADASGFMKREKDPFSNPVGNSLMKGIEGVFDELFKPEGTKKFDILLDEIIRIRAVQDFTPSKALSFIFLLKNAVREELRKEVCQDKAVSEELIELDAEIDGLALIAFDIYMGCKEKLYEIKANEIRRLTFRLLQQANLLTENKENDTPENKMDITRKEAAQ